MRRWVYRHWRCALRLLRGFCPEPILCFLRIYSSSVDCRWLHIRQYAGSSVKGGTADGRSGTSSWQGQRSGRAITSARRRRRSQVRRPPTQAHSAAALSRNVLVASNVRPLLVVLLWQFHNLMLVTQAMARARAAEVAGDKAVCEQALTDVQRAFGP